jgi:manganese/zinc-transporting P-type ATPase C
MTAPITIRHDIAGRIRVRVPRLRGVAAPQDVQQRFTALTGVAWVRVNPRSASLIIAYDSAMTTRDALLEKIKTYFEPRAASGPRKAASAGNSCSLSGCGRRRGGAGPLRAALVRFAAISIILGGVVLRGALTGRSTAQTATSPLGAAALLFTLPLIRSGLRCIGQQRVTLDGFLATGSVAAVASGEALTALEILWINSGAELLSTWIAERSRKSIASILESTSHHTFVLVDGVEVERRVEDLRPGDLVVLHTGEKISVDGVIVSGQALIDAAPINGRAESEHRMEGDTVHAGTFVREGVIRVRAESVGDKTYLARVMHKVECALENRAPIEGVADRLASSLVKLGLGATFATYMLTASAWRAFTVLLVMACPCATVLAASTAVSAAINAAARRQILIKGGRYLEEIGKCDTVFFDKTGTLTTTQPALSRVVTMNGAGESELIHLASSAETHNHHPLAQALLNEAAQRGILAMPHEVCEYHLGLGMRAEILGHEVLVGNAKLARLYEADMAKMIPAANELSAQGLTVLYVFKDRQPLGLLGFASQVRPEAKHVLRRLRSMGVRRLVLITGDEQASAEHLAGILGIDECHASVMPEDKARVLLQAKAGGERILMVGDGINDALALAQADVGVALGTAGSEVAVEAAGIAVAADNLEAVADVYALSHRTLRIVHQNFWIATGSNLVGVVAGALGLLTPVTAGLVHIGHTLGVLANSSRLLRPVRAQSLATVKGAAKN